MSFKTKLEMLGGIVVLCVAWTAIYRVWAYMPIVGLILIGVLIVSLVTGTIWLLAYVGTDIAHRVIDAIHHWHRHSHVEQLPPGHGAILNHRGKVTVVEASYPTAPPARPASALPSPEEHQENDKLPILLPGLQQPSMNYLMNELQEDKLQVCPGIRGSDGKPFVMSIPRAVHFKVIGSSGFGKSCLAGAMLQQAISTNRPERLMIALLDLEHRTSRLFEDSPNVACIRVGRRWVDMVATNADEVAEHLGYLKAELDRRASLSLEELQREPLLLIYVEEMLSLQFEVDETLLKQMLKDLSVLAVRSRKYGMFLLACSQTDYSTPELKTAQKQFRSRMAFAVDITAARAAGFMNTELIKFGFTNSEPGDGKFVLETPGTSSLMLSPQYDVDAELLALEKRSEAPFTDGTAWVQRGYKARSSGVLEPIAQECERASELRSHRSAHFDEVAELRSKGWGKERTIKKVWDANKGGSQKYQDAVKEYEAIIAELEGNTEYIAR